MRIRLVGENITEAFEDELMDLQDAFEANDHIVPDRLFSTQKNDARRRQEFYAETRQVSAELEEIHQQRHIEVIQTIAEATVALSLAS